MIYFDVLKMGSELIGSRIQKNTTMAFLNSILEPFSQLFELFYSFYETNRYELSITSSVIDLERVLNDKFDPENREIYISDSSVQLNQVIIFNEIEQNEETIIFNQSEGESDTILFNESEFVTSPNFIINIPSSLVFNENQLNQLMSIYKTAGKNYVINYF